MFAAKRRRSLDDDVHPPSGHSCGGGRDLLRQAAVALAEDAGFKAVAAASADEALAILEARQDVRLVFTDIQLPGSMDGLKLAHAVRDRWPPVELILTSGRRRIEPDDLPERGRFFPKPYDFNALFRAFQEMAATDRR
jgi:two-component system, response regulator PdtaR